MTNDDSFVEDTLTPRFFFVLLLQWDPPCENLCLITGISTGKSDMYGCIKPTLLDPGCRRSVSVSVIANLGATEHKRMVGNENLP